MSDKMRRFTSWNAKYDTDRIKTTLDAMRPDMKARYDAAMTEVMANDTTVRQVLNDKGVSTILFVPYLNFGRQLWKSSREQNIAGESLQLAAEALRLKWKAKGLDEGVLSAIQAQICSVRPEET